MVFVVGFPLQHLPLTSKMLGHRCMSSFGLQVNLTPSSSLISTGRGVYLTGLQVPGPAIVTINIDCAH